jgi:hypothetical protein
LEDIPVAAIVKGGSTLQRDARETEKNVDAAANGSFEETPSTAGSIPARSRPMDMYNVMHVVEVKERIGGERRVWVGRLE